jgi:hypothetical protein
MLSNLRTTANAWTREVRCLSRRLRERRCGPTSSRLGMNIVCESSLHTGVNLMALEYVPIRGAGRFA